MTRFFCVCCNSACLILLAGGCGGRGVAPPPEAWEPPPEVAGAPALQQEKIVLFDGSSWESWRRREGSSSPWSVRDDGSVVVGGGDAVSVRELGDFQLHLEFFCPVMAGQEGQARANSGVYLHGRYEVQVLDSYGRPRTGNGCGALYLTAPPLVNASAPPGTWQTYDIIFRAPRYDADGAPLEPPRVTVLHNGIIIHNNLEILRPTPGALDDDMPRRGPILLQDHGDPVRYRNIWVRSLD